MWHHTHPVWHHAASPEGHWLAYTIISSLIHGLIYGAIFHLFRGLGLGMVLIIAVLGVAAVAGVWWFVNRPKHNREEY
ncbi:hypothetical protein [Acidithiobacillus sp.]